MSTSHNVPTVSVVIITRNRRATLAKCLHHLRSQTLSDFEIVVVDNSTNFVTKEFIQGFRDMAYKQVSAKLGAQPLLRNEGVKMATGNIVAFLDDDGYDDPSWLSQIVSCYDNLSIGAAGGRIIQGSPHHNATRVGKLRLLGGIEGNWNYEGDQLFEVDHLQGTNMSFRKSVLEQIRGWDQVYCGGYATYEEPDVCLRVKRAGYKIMFNPKAIVVHGEQQREGGYGRSVNTSPRLAYYSGRNGTYLYLKNLGFRPGVIAASLIANPLVEIARCLFGSARNPQFTKLNGKGLLAVLLHCVGVVRGFFLSLVFMFGSPQHHGTR